MKMTVFEKKYFESMQNQVGFDDRQNIFSAQIQSVERSQYNGGFDDTDILGGLATNSR